MAGYPTQIISLSENKAKRAPESARERNGFSVPAEGWIFVKVRGEFLRLLISRRVRWAKWNARVKVDAFLRNHSARFFFVAQRETSFAHANRLPLREMEKRRADTESFCND